MIDIRNLNIWKPEEKPRNQNRFLNADIEELNLSVRAFNCLKRANCNTVRDIYNYMGDDVQSLRRIHNLGRTSEAEILEKIEVFRNQCEKQGGSIGKKKEHFAKPERKLAERKIEEFSL